MTARPLELIRLLVALQCAAWVAFAPVIPALHLAFASHGHVFCPEHERFEDAGPRQTWLLNVTSNSSDAPTADRGAIEGIDLRPACAFSNFVAQAASASAAQPLELAAALLRETRLVRVTGGVDVRPVDIVLLAPKQSPPVSS